MPAGVEVVVGDLQDAATLRPALTDTEAAFLLSGYAGIDALVPEMAAAGVERVALLSSGAAPGGELSNAVARYHILSERAVRALGRDLQFEAVPNDVARKEMTQSTPAEYVDAFFSFFVDGTIDETTVHPTVREVLGREPRSFAEWIAVHRDRFRVTR